MDLRRYSEQGMAQRMEVEQQSGYKERGRDGPTHLTENSSYL